MRTPLLRVSFVFLALLAGGGPAAADVVVSPSIARFERVDERLYRGGQPDAQGFAELKRLGVRTVINLRQDDSERATVEGLGMRYVSLATGLMPFGMDGGLRESIVQRFFEVVDDQANGPVFLHCRRGADRTGTLVAMYRIARQHWTADAAYAEARAKGMRWWYASTKRRLEAFASAPRLAVLSPAPAAALR